MEKNDLRKEIGMDDITVLNFGTLIKQLAEPTINNFSDDEVESFVKLLKRVEYKIGEFFSTPEAPNPSIAYIAKGLFRLYQIGKDGNDVTHDFTGDGMFLSSYSAITLDVISPVYVQALETSEIYAISRDEFILYWENDIRWKNVLQKYTEYDCLELRYREMELLLYDAPARYKHFLEYFKKYENRIQQKYIASYLGISPETLSRIRNMT
ncbi:MAG: Crp/Fnr family transcriptional regulator [Oscillospiraceae bacterium]|nr:Crp/Fnr family transcriptional regulator [Oscillospiraceae bacterium]